MSVTAVVFELGQLTSVDSSALSILLELVQGYRARGARVCFVKLRRHLRASFARAGILAAIASEEHSGMYRSLDRAVEDIQRQNLGHLARDPTAQSGPAAQPPKQMQLQAGADNDDAQLANGAAHAASAPAPPSRRNKNIFDQIRVIKPNFGNDI